MVSWKTAVEEAHRYTLDRIYTQFTSKWTGSDIVKENLKLLVTLEWRIIRVCKFSQTVQIHSETINEKKIKNAKMLKMLKYKQKIRKF